MFIVKVILKVQNGKEAEFEAACRSVYPQVAAEEGTLVYALNRSLDDRQSYFYYEKYREKKDFDAHMAAPYIQTLLGTLGPLLAAEPELTMYEEVASVSK